MYIHVCTSIPQRVKGSMYVVYVADDCTNIHGQGCMLFSDTVFPSRGRVGVHRGSQWPSFYQTSTHSSGRCVQLRGRCCVEKSVDV